MFLLLTARLVGKDAISNIMKFYISTPLRLFIQRHVNLALSIDQALLFVTKKVV